jgi:catechol 2,3-dioxygenase-like lactoylglutathione lyase family enzyme
VLNSLDHVIVGVRDLEQATRCYGTLLGRRPSWRGEHPSAGTANSLFRLRNCYLELLAPRGEGPVGRGLAARLDERGEGLVGLAFGTDDAEACRAAFLEAGLDPAPIQKGLGRDVDSGAFREWRNVMLPLDETRGVLVFAIQHTSHPELLPPAAAACDEAAAVSALDHAVVQTPDAEAAKAFYGDALGLRCALDRSFEQWGARLVFFRVGGVTVELAQRLREAAPEGAPDELWGLSWQVPDAAAARRRLAAAGLDVSELRDGRKPGTRVFTVRDGTCGVPTLAIEPTGRS